MITTENGEELTLETQVIRLEELYKKMDKGELLEELMIILNMINDPADSSNWIITDIHDSHFNQ